MPKASDLKRNQVVEIDGKLYITRHIDVRNPTARGAATLYKVRFSELTGATKREETYKGDDTLNDVDLVRRSVQFSYQEGGTYYFMDSEDFSQYAVDAENIENEKAFLHEGLEGILALLIDGLTVAIELPAHVELKVTDTAPALKGASATKRTKPAVLANGLTVQVPEYISNDDTIKVSTADAKYVSRA